MAETRFFSTTKSHFDQDGDMLPEWGEGIDTVQFTVPAGKKFTRYSLKKLSDTSPLAEARVHTAPRGSKGDQQIKVKWSYPVFGKIRYSLSCFAIPEAERVKPLVIPTSDSDWYDRAMEAIQQKRNFSLRLVGNPAIEFWRMIAGGKASVSSGDKATIAGQREVEEGGWIPPTPPTTGRAEPTTVVLITIAVCGTIIALAGLATIGIVLLTAINTGCESKAEQNGSLTDGSFNVDIEVSGCR